MNIIVTAEQMKSAERYMIDELGLPSVVLMEKAAERVFEVASEVCEEIFDERERACVLCGCGNNGGDGLAVARMMLQRGIDVSVCIVGDESHATDEFLLQKSIYEKLGGCIDEEPDYEATLVIDAMLGIGIKGEVRGRYLEVIDELNATHEDIGNIVIAVDIPSGINADTGVAMGAAVTADYTVCLGCYKSGLFLSDGPSHVGKSVCFDIGIEPPKECAAIKPDYEDIEEIMPKRQDCSNKSTYGKVTIVAGSEGMPGAAVLASRASLTSGVGMVKLLTDDSIIPTIVDVMPEVMVDSYYTDYLDSGDEYDDAPEVNYEAIDGALEWCDAALIGPGLGRGRLAEKVFLYVMEVMGRNGKPVVIDADGLYHLSNHMELLKEREGLDTILTPHPGEFARLFGTEIIDGKHQDLNFLKNLALKNHVTILAKDYTSIIVSAGNGGNAAVINTFGTDALATAGTGDVLAGIVLTMMVNTDDPVNACLIGNALHGLAGMLASEETNNYAVTASDVVCHIPDAINCLVDSDIDANGDKS